MTSAASGASKLDDPAQAAAQAVSLAARALKGPETATLGWLFVSPKYELTTVMQAAQRECPSCHFFGAHTAGEFTERGAMRGGVVAFLVASDALMVGSAFASGISADPQAAVATLTGQFAALAQQASTKGLGLSTSLVLLDALTGVGETLVQGLRNRTRIFQQIVGAAAADNGEYKRGMVALGDAAAADAAVVTHVFGRRAWGVGVEHAMEPVTGRMVVTRSAGSVVGKLGSRSAFDFYKEHAKSKGIELSLANAGEFFVTHPLGVYFVDDVRFVRGPVGVGDEGELHLLAPLNEGASVSLVEADVESLVNASKRAAELARKNVGEGPVAGVLVFDCVFRGMVLGRAFGRAIDAVRAVFPEVPVAGFLGYGQIARYRGRNEGWHNGACLVVAIPA